MTDQQRGGEGDKPVQGAGPLGFDPVADQERWAHREDPDLRAERFGETPPTKPDKTGGSPYGWIVGVAALLVIAYIGINTLRTTPSGSTGPKPGAQLPPFAMPLALSSLNGDANVATRSHSGQAGKVPACGVRGQGILNSCELTRRGPVVLAFLAVRGGGKCVKQLDTIERVRPQFPSVEFAAVAIRGDRGDLRKLIRKHGWDFPVGYDRDGAVANLYGVAVCPTIVLARRGGRTQATALGEVSESNLVARLRALSRARGRSSAR